MILMFAHLFLPALHTYVLCNACNSNMPDTTAHCSIFSNSLTQDANTGLTGPVVSSLSSVSFQNMGTSRRSLWILPLAGACTETHLLPHLDFFLIIKNAKVEFLSSNELPDQSRLTTNRTSYRELFRTVCT